MSSAITITMLGLVAAAAAGTIVAAPGVPVDECVAGPVARMATMRATASAPNSRRNAACGRSRGRSWTDIVAPPGV